MSTDKMTPTPWVAGGSFPYKGNEGYIFATAHHPEVLVCKTFGTIDENTPPIGEQMENSKAIVAAVNSTYGAGVNPEAVPELLECLKVITSSEHWHKYFSGGSVDKACQAAIQKSKLLNHTYNG